MQMKSGRQSRRVAQRRNGQRQVRDPEATLYAGDNVNAHESRQARLVMIVFGVTFVAACVAYVVLAAGEIW